MKLLDSILVFPKHNVTKKKWTSGKCDQLHFLIPVSSSKTAVTQGQTWKRNAGLFPKWHEHEFTRVCFQPMLRLLTALRVPGANLPGRQQVSAHKDHSSETDLCFLYICHKELRMKYLHTYQICEKNKTHFCVLIFYPAFRHISLDCACECLSTWILQGCLL